MKTLREYIDQLDEISRRDFLKGAAGVATMLALPAVSTAGDRNKTIEFMTSIAGIVWDLRKLGYSRSAALDQIEKKMGIRGEALRVAGLICNLAWSMPNGYWSRNEFVSIVKNQAERNLPIASPKMQSKNTLSAPTGDNQTDKEQSDRNKAEKEKKLYLSKIANDYSDEISKLLEQKLDNLLFKIKPNLDGPSYLRFKNGMFSMTEVQLTIDKDGQILEFNIVKKPQTMFGKNAGSEFFVNPNFYKGSIPKPPETMFNEMSKNGRSITFNIFTLPAEDSVDRGSKFGVRLVSSSNLQETTDEVERVLQLAKEMR